MEMTISELFLSITIQEWIIIVLAAALIVSIRFIRKLKQALRRRIIPEVMFEFDRFDFGLLIKNIGEIPAKYISVHDLAVTFKDYGYETDFMFKFEPVSMLEPDEQKRLSARVFQEEEEVRGEIAKKISNHLILNPFKLEITYWNLEKIRFKALYKKVKDTFSLEKIEPCKE
ncbi:hypothetical protein ACFL38_02730 [Candidatus Omnitrophota bacterium]